MTGVQTCALPIYEDLFEDLIGGLIRNEVDGAGDGDAGAEDDGHLAAHESEGLHIQLGAADIPAEEVALFALCACGGDLQDDVTVLTDAVDGLHLVIGLDDAVDAFAALRDGGIFVVYQTITSPAGKVKS